MKRLLFTLIVLMSFSTTAFTQELPAIKTTNAARFFVPAAIIKNYKLSEAKGDAWMKVYNGFEDDATIQRVNDIRWQAASKDAALLWYYENNILLTEGGKNITDQLSTPAGADNWNVYEASTEAKKLMDAMGIKQQQYTFTFVVEQYVGKIFISAREGTTVQQAYTFAKEGLSATLKAAGKTKVAELML